MEKFRVHLLVAEQSGPLRPLRYSNLKFSLFTAAVLWVGTTFSTLVSGNEPDISTPQGLLDTCSVEAKHPTEYPDGVSFLADYKAEIACTFYLSGYLEAHRVTSGLIESNKPLFCLPDVGISPDMMVSALAALLQQSPEYSGGPTRTVLAVALRQFFPCDTVE